MFKFGFSCDNSDDETNEVQRVEKDWLESKEIKPDKVNVNENLNVQVINCDGYSIKSIHNDEIVKILKNSNESNNSLISAEQNHSDLVTAVYEGGLKVWECTYDLLNFIKDNHLDVSNKKVLDLGCGAGIIGIFSCLKGARTIFQDYNYEVINYITIPNVVLNNIKFEKCAFYCGDWKSFSDLLKPTLSEKEKFDYIFTSETIYNTENYEKLLDIFSNFLKINGVIYLAAKYYYFGVGGGVGQFEDMLKRANIFNYSIAWLCSGGVKRAIIKITLK